MTGRMRVAAAQADGRTIGMVFFAFEAVDSSKKSLGHFDDYEAALAAIRAAAAPPSPARPHTASLSSLGHAST
jgi:hypothetical protein